MATRRALSRIFHGRKGDGGDGGDEGGGGAGQTSTDIGRLHTKEKTDRQRRLEANYTQLLENSERYATAEMDRINTWRQARPTDSNRGNLARQQKDATKARNELFKSSINGRRDLYQQMTGGIRNVKKKDLSRHEEALAPLLGDPDIEQSLEQRWKRFTDAQATARNQLGQPNMETITEAE